MQNRTEFHSIPVVQKLALLYPNVETTAAYARIHALQQRFSERFPHAAGSAEPILISAPGRTEIAGNHTDHNNGLVIAASVQLDVLGVVRARGDRTVVVHSHGYTNEFTVDLRHLDPRTDEQGSFAALVRGVASGLNHLGIAPQGFDCCIQSDVSAGSGLSSSAAIEVFLATALCAAAGAPLPDTVTLARLSQAAENRYFGKPCGLMDQLACAHGGTIMIDFADPATPTVVETAFEPDLHGLSLMVVESGASHDDLTGDYAAVASEMHSVAALLGGGTLRDVLQASLLAEIPRVRAVLHERAVLRSLHYYAENRRVLEQTVALDHGDMDRFLALVAESGSSSWRLLQNCTTAAHGTRQELALALALTEDFLTGTRGVCRVHGGGFAGTIQAYVPTEIVGEYRQLIGRVFGPTAVTPLHIRPVGPVVVCTGSEARTLETGLPNS